MTPPTADIDQPSPCCSSRTTRRPAGGCAMRSPTPATSRSRRPRRWPRRAPRSPLRRPRVLLTDLQLPDGHGVELIRETRQTCPDTEIMVISILGDEQSVISAIMVGATGYLLKDAFPTDIAATVRELVAGHSPISASIARFIVRRTQGAPKSPAVPPTQHRQADAARDRHIVGHRQGLQLCRDRRASRPFAPDRARPHQEHLPQAGGQHARRGRLRGAPAGPDPAVIDRGGRAGFGAGVAAGAIRLGVYLLIQAALVLASILVLRAAACRSRRTRYQLTEAMLSADGADIPSACHISCRPDPATTAPQVFTLSFDRPAGARDQAWSVLRAPLHQRASRSRSTAPSSSTAGDIRRPTGLTATRRRSRRFRPCCCMTAPMR